MATARGDGTFESGSAERLYRIAGEWSLNAELGVLFVRACSHEAARLYAERSGLLVHSVYRIESGQAAHGLPVEPPGPVPAPQRRSDSGTANAD